MRKMLPFATLACTGIALGVGIAATVPTDVRSARSVELERLSQAHVVTYPGAGQAIIGPDSYPVEYSAQWLAVAQQAERARQAKLALPDFGPPLAYDQPPPERDLAVEHEGIGDSAELPEPGSEPVEGSPPAT